MINKYTVSTITRAHNDRVDTILSHEGGGETLVLHNGSKWMGQAPDPIEKLVTNLAKYTLTDFSDETDVHDGSQWTGGKPPSTFEPYKWGFHGNFVEYSAGFSIYTDEQSVIDALRPFFGKVAAGVHIVHFEFLLREAKGSRWVKLMGSGGLVGAGATHIEPQDPHKLNRVLVSLLARVRADREKPGGLREERSKTTGDPLDIHPAPCIAVDSARVVLSNGQRVGVGCPYRRSNEECENNACTECIEAGES